MTQPLEVSPEHLFATSAGLTAAHTSATAAVSTSAATVVPVPAGADDVSLQAAVAFAAYAPGFLGAIADGFGKSLDGAQSLIPVGMEYQSTDITGGSQISVVGPAAA